jgi:chemotaxis protein histidine kinase CheA
MNFIGEQVLAHNRVLLFGESQADLDAATSADEPGPVEGHRASTGDAQASSFPALILIAGEARYAVPQLNFLERIEWSATFSGAQPDTIKLRGIDLPLANLSRASNGLRPGTQSPVVVVLQAEACSFGLVVDEVVGTQDLSPHSAHDLHANDALCAGIARTQDGDTVQVLDVDRVAERSVQSVERGVSCAR